MAISLPRRVTSAVRSFSCSADVASTTTRSADVEELDLEDQGGVRRNDGREAARAVAEVGRDHELALAADLHAGDALVPALDDLAGAELEVERLVAVARAEIGRAHV